MPSDIPFPASDFIFHYIINVISAFIKFRIIQTIRNSVVAVQLRIAVPSEKRVPLVQSSMINSPFNHSLCSRMRGDIPFRAAPDQGIPRPPSPQTSGQRPPKVRCMHSAIPPQPAQARHKWGLCLVMIPGCFFDVSGAFASRIISYVLSSYHLHINLLGCLYVPILKVCAVNVTLSLCLTMVERNASTLCIPSFLQLYHECVFIFDLTNFALPRGWSAPHRSSSYKSVISRSVLRNHGISPAVHSLPSVHTAPC